jgi:hypothetical protein
MSKERHSLSMPITEYFWVSSIMSLERAKLFRIYGRGYPVQVVRSEYQATSVSFSM